MVITIKFIDHVLTLILFYSFSGQRFLKKMWNNCISYLMILYRIYLNFSPKIS